jgi:O-antigen/teichoic acid export membrane protein
LSIRRALAFAYIERYGTIMIGLLSTMVLSRLLTPAQIGVFSVGMAVVGIVAVVREFGVSTYLVQEAELDDARVRAAFTLALAFGLGLALIVLALAVPIGRFYGDADVTRIMVIVSITFALTPLGGISQALLTRELRFASLAWIRLGHGLVLAGASVAGALAGWGAVSLAWAAVAASVFTAIASMSVRPHPIRPNLQRTDLARVFGVGSAATAISVVDEVMAALPEVVLGRMQTLADVGLFSRARTLSQTAHQLLARAAGPVFLAAFSERKRAGIPLAPGYLHATACITAAGWAALAMLAVLAEPVVRVLYGSGWMGVVEPLRWLCVAAMLALPTSGAHHILLADGGVRTALRVKIVSLIVLAAAAIPASTAGLAAITQAMVLVSAVSSLLLARAVRARLDIDLQTQLKPALSALPVALAAAAGAAIVLPFTPGASLGLSLLLSATGSISGLVAALAVGWLVKHPLHLELKALVARRRTSGGASSSSFPDRR